jgi:transcription elongation GreA/GreB family factor
LFGFLKEREDFTASEPAPQFDSDSDIEAIGRDEESSTIETNGKLATQVPSGSEEELYIELGDKVTYCYADKADEHFDVMIIDGESSPERKLTNEESPLAQALINCAVGDEPEIKVKGSAPRVIRILKIYRPPITENSTSERIDRSPAIGDKTPDYPFGFGFCQCGCNQVTQLNLSEGIWTRFIDGHEGG